MRKKSESNPTEKNKTIPIVTKDNESKILVNDSILALRKNEDEEKKKRQPIIEENPAQGQRARIDNKEQAVNNKNRPALFRAFSYAAAGILATAALSMLAITVVGALFPPFLVIAGAVAAAALVLVTVSSLIGFAKAFQDTPPAEAQNELEDNEGQQAAAEKNYTEQPIFENKNKKTGNFRLPNDNKNTSFISKKEAGGNNRFFTDSSNKQIKEKLKSEESSPTQPSSKGLFASPTNGKEKISQQTISSGITNSNDN